MKELSPATRWSNNIHSVCQPRGALRFPVGDETELGCFTTCRWKFRN